MAGVVAIVALLLSVKAYRGTLIGEHRSPDGAFSLRYYESFNLFEIVWSMPGDSACEPRWVRLFDKADHKLKEIYTTSCNLENRPRWLETELILPDGETIWKLPDRSKAP
jgi:hypothetical protein